MNQMKKLFPEGWILYCPECDQYVGQSDPQNTTRGKTVIIDTAPCDKCVETLKQEIQEAQTLMGRLGLPKETQDGTQ